MRIAAVVLVIALVAGIPAGAGATDNTVRDPRLAYPDPRTQYSDPRLQYPDPRQKYLDRRPDPSADHRPAAPAAPIVIITQPVYVAAPQACVVPGYWAYGWVPQSYVSNVWVPGYYSDDALWIEGHYESRAYSSGYYQPCWVPERAC